MMASDQAQGFLRVRVAPTEDLDRIKTPTTTILKQTSSLLPGDQIEERTGKLDKIEKDAIEQAASPIWSVRFAACQCKCGALWEQVECFFRLVFAVDIMLPMLLVFLCCLVAIWAANQNEDVLSSDYEVRDEGQYSLISDGDTFGMEAHEAAGIVLGFIIGQLCTTAAERFTKARSLVCSMICALEDVAENVYMDLKRQDEIGQAKVHFEFARLLHLLLTFSCIELEKTASRSLLRTSQQLASKMSQVWGMTKFEMDAISEVHGSTRIRLIVGWVKQLLAELERQDMLKKDGHNAEARKSMLKDYMSLWQEAHQLGEATAHMYFQVMMSVVMFGFSCSLPFSLAPSYGQYTFYPTLAVSLAYFIMYKVAVLMDTPYGFDKYDLPLSKYCEQFKIKLGEICRSTLGDKQQVWWHPSQANFTFNGNLGIVCGDDGIVQEVVGDKPAHAKGIKAGDKIISIDTKRFSKRKLERAELSGSDYDVMVDVMMMRGFDTTRFGQNALLRLLQAREGAENPTQEDNLDKMPEVMKDMKKDMFPTKLIAQIASETAQLMMRGFDKTSFGQNELRSLQQVREGAENLTQEGKTDKIADEIKKIIKKDMSQTKVIAQLASETTQQGGLRAAPCSPQRKPSLPNLLPNQPNLLEDCPQSPKMLS